MYFNQHQAKRIRWGHCFVKQAVESKLQDTKGIQMTKFAPTFEAERVTNSDCSLIVDLRMLFDLLSFMFGQQFIQFGLVLIFLS